VEVVLVELLVLMHQTHHLVVLMVDQEHQADQVLVVV
jgi:hypothetical protein